MILKQGVALCMCNNQSFILRCGKHISEILRQLKFTSRQTNDNKYVT